MQYIVGDNKYSLSYTQLKEEYDKYISMSDDKFFSDVPKLLHFICIVVYLKEIKAYNLVSDEGLIHQLIHFICDDTKDDKIINNKMVKDRVRNDFKHICKLA